MHTIVIGGTGHIGSYLVPRLVDAGHQVTVITRGKRQPYRSDGRWRDVKVVHLDRKELEKTGEFAPRIAEMNAEVVIDLICFNLESCRQIVEALRGKVQHFLHCGTMWVHGTCEESPVTEQAARRPMGAYGIRKEEIERYLMAEARRDGFPATVLHPGHIVGRGWWPINPAGNLSAEPWLKLATAQELILPNFGLEVLHHVHADDVAQAFEKAMTHWASSCGEAFHVVSPASMSLRGYAQSVARWFGKGPNLKYMHWEEWKTHVTEENARITLEHIQRSLTGSIEKARRLIGYEPRYTSLQAIYESLDWLLANGQLKIDGIESSDR